MRSKVTLILVFLNVALFFFIFHFERDWRTERASLEARRRVLGSEAADIRTLEVASDVPGASFRIERRGDAWFITKPFEWPANPNAVSRILNELQFLEHETSFSARELARNGQSLADYGLERPKLTATFTSGEPPVPGAARPITTVLRLGDTTRVGHRLYLLSPDGALIHVVSGSLAESLALPLEQLRADTLFTIPVFEARALSLQTTRRVPNLPGAAASGLRVRLRRDPTNRWKFETPVLALASKTATELAINGLDALRVKAFVSGPGPAILPSAAPELTVTLEGNNRDETLYLGGETPDHDTYAQLKDRSPVFTVAVPRALLEDLRNAPDELRDRHVLDFDPRAVTAIALSTPNQPELALQRLEASGGAGDEGASWQIVRRGAAAPEAQTLPADRAAVGQLLERLAALTAVRFQSDAPTDAALEDWGFKSPEREIALTLGGPYPSQTTLQIGRSTRRSTAGGEPDAYARVAGTPSVFAIGPEILAATPVSVLAWRDRLIHQLPPSARISALTLTDTVAHTVIYGHTLAEGETWETAFAGESADRRRALLELIQQVRTLRARNFVQEGLPDQVLVAGELRPWRYRLDAAIVLPGGNAGAERETLTLGLTDRLGGTEQLAGSKEFGVVFGLPQTVVDALWTLTYGRRDPGPPAVKAP
jgi:hypothetical protein